MACEAPAIADMRKHVGRWVGRDAILTLVARTPAVAEVLCRQRPHDPASARLQLLDMKVGRQLLPGKVKNGLAGAVLGVIIWVNYFIARIGCLVAQRCIQVGDLRSGGEEASLPGHSCP
jgi:hypothetical protein